MKISIKTTTVLLFILSLNAYASDGQKVLKRLSLMSYVSKVESQYVYELKWTQFEFPTFQLIDKAYSYKDGDSCLILGFKSTYKNGRCKLKYSEDAKKYKDSCPIGQLACNPEIFGTKEKAPFCISPTMGWELSKYCSYISIVNLAKGPEFESFSEKTKESLDKLSNIRPIDFNYEMVTELSSDNKFNKAFLRQFNSDDNLEKAISYTKDLCNSIYSAKESKSSKLDLENCESQLSVIKSNKLSNQQIIDQILEEAGDISTSFNTNEQTPPKQPSNPDGLISEDIDLDKPQGATCKVPEGPNSVEENLENMADLKVNLEAKNYLSCAEELYHSKGLPEEARGNYFHQIGDKRNFAKGCWDLESRTEDEQIYAFVSEQGFKLIRYPVFKTRIAKGVVAELPRNMMRFFDGDKSYFISEYDNLGQYFDSFPEENLDNFVKERDILEKPATIMEKYVKAYEDKREANNLDRKVMLTDPDDVFSVDDLKSCISERLKDYVGIIMYRSHEELFPYTNQLNEDLQLPDRSVLRDKYSKTSDEIKESLKAKIFKDDSSCGQIIGPEDFDKIFKKTYNTRLENYNNYRKYFLE